MKPKELNIEEKSKQIILEFFNGQKEFKKVQTEFEELKTKFNSAMEKLFEVKKTEGPISFESNFAEGTFKVKKIQKSSVIFDCDKLEKVLDKKITKDVIDKRYEIIDMFGLIAYLKECNVDPKVFKSFLSVTKSVDVKELERLEETGKLTIEQLEGCYTVKKQNPYFTIRVKK